MSPAKNNGLIHTKNMSRTSTLHAEHMFKVSSQYLKNCRSSSRHKILLNRAPLQKIMDWSTGKKKSSRKSTHEHMFKVSSRYLENCWRCKCHRQTGSTNQPTNQPDDDSYIPPILRMRGYNKQHRISIQ